MEATSRGVVNYTSRDYESIMADFWKAVPILTELWKPEADADPGVVLGKFLASVADMVDKHYLVYAHVLPDKSAYVGMTGTSMQNRSGADGCMYKQHQLDLYEAAKSFGGWDHIDHYVLSQGLTYEAALELEEEFTKLFEAAGYKMFNKKCGYKGYKHTESSKLKISEAGKGRICSDDTKQKISQANSNKVRTEDQKIAASRRMKAYYTPERRAEHSRICSKINQDLFSGKPLSEETKQKISSKLKGRTMSEEWRSKISNSLLGNVPSNAKPVIAIVDGNKLEFVSSAECDKYFNKYSGWASMYCRDHKLTPEGIQLYFKEAI